MQINAGSQPLMFGWLFQLEVSLGFLKWKYPQIIQVMTILGTQGDQGDQGDLEIPHFRHWKHPVAAPVPSHCI